MRIILTGKVNGIRIYIQIYAAATASGGTLNFAASSSNSASFFAIDITKGCFGYSLCKRLKGKLGYSTQTQCESRITSRGHLRLFSVPLIPKQRYYRQGHRLSHHCPLSVLQRSLTVPQGFRPEADV